MAGVATGELPPLSEILTANWDFLTETAMWYTRLATAWEAAFTEVRDGLTNPGGAPWDGYGAEAAQQRGQSDLMAIFGKTEQLHNAANILTRGFEKQTANQESVREAVNDAIRDEFSVDDDYSVSETREVTTEAEYQERLHLAKQHAKYLAHRVYALLSDERQLARDHTRAIDGIEDLNFTGGDGEAGNGKVVLVDNEVPLAPGAPLPLYPPGAWDQVDVLTDLAGNQLVLRRGYWDPVSGTGFGWAKISGKHGVTNLDHLKRDFATWLPTKKPDGSLIYEFPVHHVVPDPLRPIPWWLYPRTKVIGEFTMRVVADPRNGQGIITAYPIEHGSGVVQVGPGWTKVPEWYNTAVRLREGAG